MRPIIRMPGEVEYDREPVPGSHLRIIGRFEWAPRMHVGDTTIPTGSVFNMERVASGVCYHAETPTKVREVLETYGTRRSGRLALHYGDTETGREVRTGPSIELEM